MIAKITSLISAIALTAAFAVAPIPGAGTAFADGKKSDRLPIAAATNVCDDKILGNITDECVQTVVENTVVKPVKTTTVEWRDEDNAVSTLVRVPDVDLANVTE